MWVSAGTTAGEMAWRRWDGIGSSGQVVGWLERMSLETSASENGENDVNECMFAGKISDSQGAERVVRAGLEDRGVDSLYVIYYVIHFLYLLFLLYFYYLLYNIYFTIKLPYVQFKCLFTNHFNMNVPTDKEVLFLIAYIYKWINIKLKSIIESNCKLVNTNRIKLLKFFSNGVKQFMMSGTTSVEIDKNNLKMLCINVLILWQLCRLIVLFFFCCCCCFFVFFEKCKCLIKTIEGLD